MSNGHAEQDLTVKGESIERIYGHYRGLRYLVNRRYQRKLVWTLDEKRRFIDSITNGYPVPIILLAESRSGASNYFEIIDGMQRLNAITSFLENDFSVGDHFFDLNTMAHTKALLDEGELQQRQPVLERSVCVGIASYTVPLSIYEFSGKNEVDEVFRRINSGGHKLSRQELRAAGSTGHFAQLVRAVASKVRGDVSSGDELPFNDMKKISIAHRDLPYGLDVDEIFWVKQGVLTKEQVRESKDEEIIADLLAFMVLDNPPSSRSELLDDYFGIREGEASMTRFHQIELAVQKHTPESIIANFQRVLEELSATLAISGRTFGQLLFGTQPTRAPRYFQVVFLALHKLMVHDNLEVQGKREFIDLLDGSASSIRIPEGGRWGAADRTKAVNATAGMYQPAFHPAQDFDPSKVQWIMRFQNLLVQSFTEQSAYDFKQGFLRLDSECAFDEASFEKILRTLVGIANIRKGTRGYVVIGVADDGRDARRVLDLFGVQARQYEGFFITGVAHEAEKMGKTLDELFKMITQRVRNSGLSAELRDYVARNVKLVRYYDKAVIILESQAQDDPSHYSGEYHVRHGNELHTVESKDFADLFKRFSSGM